MSKVHLALAVFLVLFSTSGFSAEKRIAITFDDAPRASSLAMSGEQRTQLLIKALAKANVTGAMFFATTSHLEAEGESGHKRLENYVEAGHVLGNHSHAHQSANRLSADEFLADIRRADETLSKFEGYHPLMRFPYLHEGDTREKRDVIRQGLQQQGLRQGYVTIDNYDWYLQALLDESLAGNRKFDVDAWRNIYVDVLMAAIQKYDEIAMRALGRSPAHVLLLHENDLAALFVDDLVAALNAEGWEVISTLEAYEDPLFEQLPDTLFLGQGRVAAIAEAQGMPRVNLRHYMEDEAVLRSIAVSAGITDIAEGAYLGEATPGMQPQLFAPDKISKSDRFEYATSFSADGREMYFGVARENHRGEILATRYEQGAWTDPEVVLTDAEHSFADPFLSKDGTRLYFISTTPADEKVENKNFDLWYARRTWQGWSDPINLGAAINASSDDYYVSFTNEGMLAFASDRDATARGDFNIYLSEPEAQGFGTPYRLPGQANTGAYEADPFIAPDGSYILFSSARRSGQGKRDIYASFKTDDGTWSRAVPLGNGVNISLRNRKLFGT